MGVVRLNPMARYIQARASPAPPPVDSTGRVLMPRTVFSPSRGFYSTATQSVINNMARVAQMFHFTEVRAPHVPVQSMDYLRAFVAEWQRAAYFLSLYPWCWPPTYHALRGLEQGMTAKFPVAGTKGRFSALYVDDLPLALLEGIGSRRDAQNQGAFLSHERDYLRCQDALIVFNDAMRDWVLAHHDRDPESVISCRFLDYPVDFDPPSQKTLGETVRVGSATGYITGYVGDWISRLPRSESLVYQFYGPKGEWIPKLKRPDLQWWGEIADPFALCRALSEGADFGILCWADSRRPYLRYGTGVKFSTYAAAGLPMLVRSDFDYPARMVKEMGLGLVFDSVRDLPSLLEGLSQTRYDRMRANVLALGERVRRSEFLLTAMLKAFSLSFR